MLINGVAETGFDMATGDTDPTIFDRAHLRQYTNGDENLERELLGLFLGQFTPLRTQLHAAIQADDWKFAAHTLKGSARSIGAPQIGSLAERLERIGFTAPADVRATALAELDQALADFTAEAEKLTGAGE